MIAYLQLHPHMLLLGIPLLAVVIYLAGWRLLRCPRWFLGCACREDVGFDDEWRREPSTDEDAAQLILDLRDEPLDLPGPATLRQGTLFAQSRAGGLHRDWARDGFEYECALVWDWARREERLWAELLAETRELCGAAA